MNENEWLLLQNQLCFSLYAASKEVIRLYQPLLSPLGLTYTQYICMLVLWEKQTLTVTELCERTLLDTGTITPLLKKLEQAGWVERARDKRDERIVRISLTEKGSALRESAKDIPQKAFCATGISAQDALRLKSDLDALLRTMSMQL